MTMTTINAPVVVAPAPVIPDVIAANARELDDLRTAIKVMEKREKVLRDALLSHLVSIDEDAVSDGNVSISVHRSARSGIATKRLEALYPKVYADVKTSTPVIQVRVAVKG